MAADGDEDVESRGSRGTGTDGPVTGVPSPADRPPEPGAGEQRRTGPDSSAAEGTEPAAAVAVAPGGARPAHEADDGPDADVDDGPDDFPDEEDESGAAAETEPRSGMTPRQARRVRAVVSGVVMAVVAVALVLRLGSAPSLLTVAGYGFALVLSGTAIVLSRRGRTRVATAVLACGVVTIVLAERALAAA